MGKVNRNLASHGPGRTHPRANALAVRTGAMMRSVLQFVADRAAHGAAHDKQDRNHEGVRRGFKCRWFHSHPPYAVEDMLSKSHVQGQRRAENTERSKTLPLHRHCRHTSRRPQRFKTPGAHPRHCAPFTDRRRALFRTSLDAHHSRRVTNLTRLILRVVHLIILSRRGPYIGAVPIIRSTRSSRPPRSLYLR